MGDRRRLGSVQPYPQGQMRGDAGGMGHEVEHRDRLPALGTARQLLRGEEAYQRVGEQEPPLLHQTQGDHGRDDQLGEGSQIVQRIGIGGLRLREKCPIPQHLGTQELPPLPDGIGRRGDDPLLYVLPQERMTGVKKSAHSDPSFPRSGGNTSTQFSI